MKFLGAFLIYLLITQLTISVSSSTSTYKITLKNKYRAHHKHTHSASHGSTRLLSRNKWFNMIIAAFGEMAGGVDLSEEIVECLPPSWRPNIENSDKESGDDAPAKSAGRSSYVLKKVAWVVSKVTFFICKFRGLVAKLLGGAVRRQMRRQQMRLNFMEVKSNSPSRNFKYYRKWFGAKLFRKAKNLARRVGRGIARGIKKGFNAVKKVAKKVINAIKNLALKIVKELKDIFRTFVNKIKQIIFNPIVQNIVRIIKCGFKLGGHVKEIIGTIMGIVNRIQKVIRSIVTQTYIDLVIVLIDLLCNFKHFAQAVDYLIQAIREKRTLQKFILIGKFFGRLLYALGSGGKGKKGRKGGRRGSGRGNKRPNRYNSGSRQRRRKPRF